MMLIERLLGPGQEYCAGQSYIFAPDAKGRAVAKVNNLLHVQCFLSIEHYRKVEETNADDKSVKAGKNAQTRRNGGNAKPNPAENETKEEAVAVKDDSAPTPVAPTVALKNKKSIIP